MVTAELILKPVVEVKDSSMFWFGMFLLILLGIYIFIISPKKARKIRDQDSIIKLLKSDNKHLQKKLSLLENE